MAMFNQKYITLLICTILCFSCLEHGYGNGSHHVEELLQLGNKSCIVRENNLIIASDVASGSSFNVKDYGAKGDGINDDSAAFLAAFRKTCQLPYGVMLVPSGSTYLLQSVVFDGSSCKPNITVQVDGNVVAPLHKSDWKNVGAEDWILFDKFYKGIKVGGKGVMDGSGQDWWESQISGGVFYIRTCCVGQQVVEGAHPPNIIRFRNCQDVTLTGITVQNSPWFHIIFLMCTRVTISDLNVSSPGDSPNTDGIHLTSSQHIDIHNTNIGAGDDCVSIQNSTYDVQIHGVHCGPGHGYSIGSLGECNSLGKVSQVSVYDSTVAQSQNGVRIKTWQGGSGYVSDVKFINVHMDSVDNPVVINQHYCIDRSDCDSSVSTAVNISRVLYQNITGTFTKTPVFLNCSSQGPCRNITIDTIQLRPAPGSSSVVDPFCLNVYGQLLTNTTPPLGSCLKTG